MYSIFKRLPLILIRNGFLLLSPVNWNVVEHRMHKKNVLNLRLKGKTKSSDHFQL